MRLSLSKINNLLLVLIFLIDGYIIVCPLLPAVISRPQAGRQEQLNRQIRSDKKPAKPQANQVIIPSMGLDKSIYDGPASQQYQILNEGIWRLDTGSTPDKGGNTVLIGHRYTYTNPQGVFYYLNKVKIGNEIGVWWGNKKYLYKVSDIKEVPPTDTAIENNTRRPELTLFTCTPLWWPKDRLVVIADLETNR